MTKTYNESTSPTVIVTPPGERYRETQGAIIVIAKKFSRGGAHCVVAKDWNIHPSIIAAEGTPVAAGVGFLGV
jgi:hypothetical protein